MARRKWNYSSIQEVLSGNNPFIQVGYSNTPNRKEGEIWTDISGTTWKQQNGWKVRVNKQADLVHKIVKQICSRCKRDLRWSNNRYDQKMFPKTGMCYDCVIEVETEMRANGTYASYERKKVLNNMISVAKEFKEKTIESINYLKNLNNKIELYNQDTNLVETWSVGNKKIKLKELKDDVKKTNKRIKELKLELKNCK